MLEIKENTYEEKKKTISPEIFIRTFKRDIFLKVIGFFVAMAMPLPEMAPFGMSYLSQERKFSLGAIFTFLFTGLGSFLACGRLVGLKYVSAGVIYMMVLFVLKKGVVIKDMTAAIIAGASIVFTGLISLIFEKITPGGVLLLLCEAAMVVCGSLVMEKSIKLLKNKPFDISSVDSDTKISLSAILLIAILSLKAIYLGSEISVMNCVAATVLLIVAQGCAAEYSTGAGVILGIVCGIGGDYFLPVLGAFSFCGFLSGLFSKFGRGGTIAGIVLANGIMAVYNNNALESVLSIYEVILSSVLFWFVPQKTAKVVREIIMLDENERQNIIKLKTSIQNRLNSVAKAFESMAKTLEKLSRKTESEKNMDVSYLFDQTADKVCLKCKKSSLCWGKNYNSTYNAMFKLLAILNEKGTVKPEDGDKYFKDGCINYKNFTEELNHQFDIYRVRQLWRSKLSESRELSKGQLLSMSKIICDLAGEIEQKETSFKKDLSPWEMRMQIESKGIKVKEVNISRDKFERTFVEVVVGSKHSRRKDYQKVLKSVRAALGGNVILKEEAFEGRKRVRLTFAQTEKYAVETQHASKAASDKNGDNFRFLKLSGGKFAVAVSDGMGTGSRAAKESEAILELLDSFLMAGFDTSVAIRLINSIMIMKSEDEAFVTLDLCIIDLYTGEVRFIKTGAEPSFILNKNGRVETIRSASLPIGLIPEVEAEVAHSKVHDGDSIVMITDGIENRESGNLWVSEFIRENLKDTKDTVLAKEILNRAIEKNNGTVKDDMTVLSLKLKAVG